LYISTKPKPVTLKVEQAFRHKLLTAEMEFGQSISTFVYSKQDWCERHRMTPLYQNIQKEGLAI
jgi:uncharacterized protein